MAGYRRRGPVEGYSDVWGPIEEENSQMTEKVNPEPSQVHAQSFNAGVEAVQKFLSERWRAVDWNNLEIESLKKKPQPERRVGERWEKASKGPYSTGGYFGKKLQRQNVWGPVAEGNARGNIIACDCLSPDADFLAHSWSDTSSLLEDRKELKQRQETASNNARRYADLCVRLEAELAALRERKVDREKLKALLIGWHG
jgi:hypothetical protein